MQGNQNTGTGGAGTGGAATSGNTNGQNNIGAQGGNGLGGTGVQDNSGQRQQRQDNGNQVTAMLRSVLNANDSCLVSALCGSHRSWQPIWRMCQLQTKVHT